MIDRSYNIAKTLIFDENFRNCVGNIFPDSIILNTQFRFVAISQNILDATGYKYEELVSKSISCISASCDLEKALGEKLRKGYFDEEPFQVTKKNEGAILYAMSGFYLGLVGDVNRMIVLKWKNLDEINFMYDRLETKTAEIDRFVYLSAHALRGPLATMKGLIGLIKTCEDKDESKFLISQLAIFSDKLDDKLHRLIFFAESDKEHESHQNALTLQQIGESLKENISEATIDHPINFSFDPFECELVLEHSKVILSMLRNLVLFFCQRETYPNNRISISVHSSDNAAEFILRAGGFSISEQLKEKLSTTNFGYSEILLHQELVNCYAAKKIIFKLRGDVHFVVNAVNEVVILITIPRGARTFPVK
jgi:hypothetical protein